MKVNGAYLIAKSLLNAGVDILFGYPGGAIMPTYDALYDFKSQLRHILVRHEQGAVHAATGYARSSGKVGVCIATSGPGATNLITGIADAMLDSTPLVCITGQVMSSLLGTDAFQEADIIGMTIPVTKWNYQITCAREIPFIMAKAFRVAQQGRPGPVLIDITKDAQLEIIENSNLLYQQIAQETVATQSQDVSVSDLKRAAMLINNAVKPYIFVGHGVLLSRAEHELLQLAEKSDSAVASTLLGLSAFPSKHHLFKGMLGMHGNYAANMLVNEADVVIAVGMRFDDRVTGNLSNYLKKTQVIHIEIDPAEINKNVAATVALQVDAKSALQQLLPYINNAQHAAWHQQFKQLHQQEFDQVISPEIYPHSENITMAECIHMISERTAGNSVVLADVGQHQMITARYYQFSQSRSFITSGGLGTMGFALPAGIGAKLACPEREVIVVSGDGGFQMNIQELAVIMQEKLNVKMIILNNSFLGMVRQWQELFFEKRYAFTALENPDFVAIAAAYGIAGCKVTTRDDLSTALDTLLHSKSSYLLEVIVENQENVFPMIASGASVNEIQLTKGK